MRIKNLKLMGYPIKIYSSKGNENITGREIAMTLEVKIR